MNKCLTGARSYLSIYKIYIYKYNYVGIIYLGIRLYKLCILIN